MSLWMDRGGEQTEAERNLALRSVAPAALAALAESGVVYLPVALFAQQAALAHGGPACALLGDLALLHDQNGLVIGPEEPRPDLTIVVVNNDGGGIFHFLPQEEAMVPEEFEGLLGTPRSVDVAKAADMFGIEHRNIDDLEQLGAALSAGTGLIEVPVDRQENLALHRRLTEAAQEALAALLPS